MSVKGVLKKKFKLKNSIISIQKKKQKIKQFFVESSIDTYHQFDADNIESKNTILNNVKTDITTTRNTFKNENFCDITLNKNVITPPTKIKKQPKSISSETNNKCEVFKKKKVTFAADVKSEKEDQKVTANNMKLLSLNKRKKLNYIKKLKAKKNKQKNIKKCEENATATSTPRQERALEYLMLWKNDRSNWKFKKIYQLWLIKNTYDSIKISKEYFEILVDYFQTIEGKSHNLILQNANSIIIESSTSNEQQEILNLSQTIKYQRARTIIQMFS